MPTLFRQWKMKTFSPRGYSLTSLEFKDQVPFEVKRMYYMTHFPEASCTNQHCHLLEEEVFIVAQGSIVLVLDRGNGKEDIFLEEGDAVYLSKYVWHGFKNPSPETVLIALSSTNYSPDRSDYIEDYDEYLKIRDEKLKV
jgi:mannose-6-phosphate isomerase-like protein (cupin superfamily)